MRFAPLSRYAQVVTQVFHVYPWPSHSGVTSNGRKSDMLTQFNARGVVAMANAGPDTNKAQFFIAYAKQPHLDGKYTVFGRVIDGADDVLDAMERAPVGPKNRPINEIRLERVTVHANPIADTVLRV